MIRRQDIEIAPLVEHEPQRLAASRTLTRRTLTPDRKSGASDRSPTSAATITSTASTCALAPRGAPAHVAFVEAVSARGYIYRGDGGFADHLFFRRDTDGLRSHHLHVAPLGGAYWVDHLLFRDYLRAHPERAAAYGALKRRLAAELPESRPYTEAKTAFVEAVLEEARR